jgi:hypothetical protein
LDESKEPDYGNDAELEEEQKRKTGEKKFFPRKYHIIY